MVAVHLFLAFAALAMSLLVRGQNPPHGFVVVTKSDIFSELRANLSSSASIIFPNDPLMQTAGARWQAYSRPSYQAVVEVATEEDVQSAVCFANRYSIPFLAVDGGHGSISTLGRMQHGIAISFRKMKTITVNPDGLSAHLGPGVTNGEVVRALWAENKQTVTGNCLCSGVMGVMLGGGHGYLQGLYGLLADQILEARVVLADGSAVTASSESNPNLYWALRGAGHNFGIITGLKYKVYDASSGPFWTQINLVFKGDKVEEFFAVSNGLIQEANHPANLLQWSTYMRRPDIDIENAVITSNLIYQGTAEDLEKYAAPFRTLGPVRATTTTVPYPELYRLNRNTEDSREVCEKGWYRHLFPVSLKCYNPRAQRKAYDIYNNLTATYPAFARGSIHVIEGYSTQGVKSVPHKTTAVPFREDSVLQSPVWGYTDPSIADEVIAAGKEIRRVLVEGSDSKQLHAYVNYAFGDETLPEMYGHEPWRVAKLKKLKQKFDPTGKFNFYAPID